MADHPKPPTHSLFNVQPITSTPSRRPHQEAPSSKRHKARSRSHAHHVHHVHHAHHQSRSRSRATSHHTSLHTSPPRPTSPPLSCAIAPASAVATACIPAASQSQSPARSPSSRDVSYDADINDILANVDAIERRVTSILAAVQKDVALAMDHALTSLIAAFDSRADAVKAALPALQHTRTATRAAHAQLSHIHAPIPDRPSLLDDPSY